MMTTSTVKILIHTTKRSLKWRIRTHPALPRPRPNLRALAHALWLPRGARVIEVFPAHKRRWGYRNMCQYAGCLYTQFRGGVDVRLDGGDFSKRVDVDEWVDFVGQWLLQAGLQHFLKEP